MVNFKSKKEILKTNKQKKNLAVHGTDIEDLCNRSQVTRKLCVTVCMHLCCGEEVGEGTIGSSIMAERISFKTADVILL